MSHHATGPLPSPISALEVAEGIFAYVQHDGTWWINNTGFLVGSRGVVAIDACSTVARTRALQAAISQVSPLPVRTLINTHHHGDHTFGNFLFDTATIVGHERVRDGIRAFGPPRSAPFWTEVDWGEVQLEPPFLTYDTGVTVWVDDLRCEVQYIGAPAHTTNDSIVWIPERNLLFSGDLLFNGGTPFLVQGSIAGARQALERLRTFEAHTIVPGHGPVAGPDLIDSVDHYLEFVQYMAASGYAAGISPLDLAQDIDLGEFSTLTDSERIVGNLHRAYAECQGLEWGVALDLPAILRDMVEYNGGQPLTCLA